MPSLDSLLTGKPDFPEPILPQAHFQEFHWVLDATGVAGWNKGAIALQGAFPRETRVDRPSDWYAIVRDTHWPGKVLPGNGPFYVPEWLWADMPAQEATYTSALQRVGFRRVVAHVVILPDTKDYLVHAMRAAAKHRWTANPELDRCYLYPRLRGTPALRTPFTVDHRRLPG